MNKFEINFVCSIKALKISSGKIQISGIGFPNPKKKFEKRLIVS